MVSAGSIRYACHEMSEWPAMPLESSGGKSQLHMIWLFAARGCCYSALVVKNCTESAIRFVTLLLQALSKNVILAFSFGIYYFFLI